jgi:hypothetical protein
MNLFPIRLASVAKSSYLLLETRAPPNTGSFSSVDSPSILAGCLAIVEQNSVDGHDELAVFGWS